MNEDTIEMFNKTITDIDNAALGSDSAVIPTSSVVSAKISQVETDLQSNIDAKADTSAITNLENHLNLNSS